MSELKSQQSKCNFSHVNKFLNDTAHDYNVEQTTHQHEQRQEDENDNIFKKAKASLRARGEI